MYTGLHTTYQLFLSDINGIWIFTTDCQNISKLQNFMKIRPVGAELVHADRQTDITKTVVAFRNFANAPKTKQDYNWRTPCHQINLPNLKIFHKTLTTVARIYTPSEKKRHSLRRFSRNSFMLNSIMFRFSAKPANKCCNYGHWLSLDRFSPHMEMFYAEISRLTSNAQGRPSFSRFASTALCISFPYSSRSQSIIPSQSPRSTKFHVTWCSISFFFSYVRTPQLSLPSALLPSLLNFLLNFLFFSTAVHLSYRRVVLASLQGISAPAARGRFSCACLQFGQPTVKGPSQPLHKHRFT